MRCLEKGLSFRTPIRPRIEGKHKYRTFCVWESLRVFQLNLCKWGSGGRIWRKEEPKRKLEIEVSFPKKWEYLKGGGENHRGAKHLVSLPSYAFFSQFPVYCPRSLPKRNEWRKESKIYHSLRKKSSGKQKILSNSALHVLCQSALLSSRTFFFCPHGLSFLCVQTMESKLVSPKKKTKIHFLYWFKYANAANLVSIRSFFYHVENISFQKFRRREKQLWATNQEDFSAVEQWVWAGQWAGRSRWLKKKERMGKRKVFCPLLPFGENATFYGKTCKLGGKTRAEVST